MVTTAASGPSDEWVRLRAGIVSLVVACVLLAVKYAAYRMTGSTAILSDALESITNVVAALFAVSVLVFAGRPADRNHPYGHGKMEFFSAVFEALQDAIRLAQLSFQLGGAASQCLFLFAQ